MTATLPHAADRRVGDATGLHWPAKILYPELFKDNLRPKVTEFYKLFYHREPTDDMLDALFADGTVPK